MLELRRILSTTPSENGFGFFRYARELAGPKPPMPLRQICSLMRVMGCSLLVEEEEKDLTPEAQEEIALLGIAKFSPLTGD